ncbi:hypothetical protein BJ742DRAFT_826889, partial [Cladochytrium replicatum]
MCSLDRQTIERYSRQLLLPEVGCEGQERLLASSVVVVGAGGIGSSALLYLACAGIGRIGIVDYDVVDRSNLQRQIIHSDERVGMLKVRSAQIAVKNANPTCNVEVHDQVLDQTNALAILEKYNVVVDASDNVATRYLLSDASVILGKTLVSGSAIRMEGQLTVYNHHDGPCYRCLFPDPPPVETVANCNEAGVLGVVPGIIGCYIALEVIKIVCGHPTAYSQKMLLFDGLSGVSKVVKLRGKHPHCFACGEHQITELVDYVQFCGSPHNDQGAETKVLEPSDRISCKELASYRASGSDCILVDVRDSIQYKICRLPDSHHIPLKELPSRTAEIQELSDKRQCPVFVICRLGNDSQIAVNLLKDSGVSNVKDVTGGLRSWSKTVDPEFPTY